MAIDVLEAEQDAGVAGATPSQRPRHRRRWIIGALVFAVLAATLGYVTGNEVQSNTEFDQTHAALGVTRYHVDIVLADLATVRHELEVVNGQVSAASTALAQDAALLKGAQIALANVHANVTLQRTMIGDLQACLGGVEQASNALAVGDQNQAIGALDAVSTSCASAVASGG